MAIDWPEGAQEFALQCMENGVPHNEILRQLRDVWGVPVKSRTTLWNLRRKDQSGSNIPASTPASMTSTLVEEPYNSTIPAYAIPTPPAESSLYTQPNTIPLHRPRSDPQSLRKEDESKQALVTRMMSPSVPDLQKRDYHSGNQAIDFSANLDYWNLDILPLYENDQNWMAPLRSETNTMFHPPTYFYGQPQSGTGALQLYGRQPGSADNTQPPSSLLTQGWTQGPSNQQPQTPSTPGNQGQTPQSVFSPVAPQPSHAYQTSQMPQEVSRQDMSNHEKSSASMSTKFPTNKADVPPSSFQYPQRRSGLAMGDDQNRLSGASTGTKDSGYHSFRSSTATILSEYCDSDDSYLTRDELKHMSTDAGSILDSYSGTETAPDLATKALGSNKNTAPTPLTSVMTPVSRQNSMQGAGIKLEDDASPSGLPAAAESRMRNANSGAYTDHIAATGGTFFFSDASTEERNQEVLPLHLEKGVSLTESHKLDHLQDDIVARESAPSVALHDTHEEYDCNHETHLNFKVAAECAGCGVSVLHYLATKPYLNGNAGPGSYHTSIFMHPQKERIDRFKNSVMHYYAASAPKTGVCQTFMALRQAVGSWADRNTFGETPLHVLNIANISGEDLYQLFNYVTRDLGQQFLLQARDLNGRTIFHALSEHPRAVDLIEDLFRCFDVGDSDKVSVNFQNILNCRDNAGNTPARNLSNSFSKTFTKAFTEALMSGNQEDADKAELERKRITQTLKAKGAYWNEQRDLTPEPHISSPTDLESKANMMDFLLHVDQDYRRRLLEEDDRGRTVLHCLPHVDLDPSARLASVRRALETRIYVSQLNALVRLDVNSFDKSGMTPLHAAIEGTKRRSQGPKLSEQLETELQSLGVDQRMPINDFLTFKIFDSKSPSTIVTVITDCCKQWDMHASTTSIGSFLKRARDEDKLRDRHQQTYLHELLQNHDPLGPRKQHSFSSPSVPRAKAPRTKRFSEDVKTESENIVEEYKRRGADINLKDRFGRSPLYLACIYGLTDFVRALLKNGANMQGANVHTRDLQGVGVIVAASKRAKDIAYQGGDEDLAMIHRCINLIREYRGVEEPSSKDEFFVWCNTCRARRHDCAHKLPQLQHVPLYSESN